MRESTDECRGHKVFHEMSVSTVAAVCRAQLREFCHMYWQTCIASRPYVKFGSKLANARLFWERTFSCQLIGALLCLFGSNGTVPLLLEYDTPFES